jgi:hypothetical protein
MLKKINKILIQNDYVRYFLLILLAILITRTYYPIPSYLEYHIENSDIVKFFILFLFGIVLTLPVTHRKLFVITIIAIIILFIFNHIRGWKAPEDDEMIKMMNQ